MSEKDKPSTPYTDDGRNTHLPLPSTNPAPAPAQTNKSKLFKLALLWGTIYAGTWYFDTSVSDFIARPDGSDIEKTSQGWGSDPYFRGLIDKGWKIDGTVDEKLLELLEGIDTSGYWLQGDSYAFGNEYEVEKHHKKDKHKHKHGKDKKKKKHGHHHDDDDDEHHHHHHGPPGRHHPPGPPHGPPGPHHPPGHPGHHGPGGPRIGPKEAESIFLGVPNNDSVAAASKRYTAYPHMAGTGNDLISAINLKAEYETLLGLPFGAPYEKIYPAGSEENQRMVRGLGEREDVAVWVDEYYPLMNKPVHRSVDIILPESNGVIEWSAKLREDIVEGDPDSVFRDEVPTFHGLSVSGNVTGKIVYAGYGTKRDFDALEAKGFDLRSEPTIVLVKYGKVFRGLKIKAAQEAGALACLIYSDPGDDGEITVKNGYKAYPDGPARQPSSVQRGSVQFLSSYPGDPATPGYPAWKNATRVPGGNFPSIPSLPISYQDALPLLKTLQGHGMPAADVGDDWVGGLTDEIDYWTGPGDRDVRFVNEVDTKETPIWSVFGYIPGHIKDELVVLGNHRDAWVLGGADPSSGTATMYEVLRGLNQLMRKGWKPMRSILVASWDAEEYGLISSTEFAEDFGDWIQSNVVAYLNLDVSVAGTNFHGSASPSLANLLKGAAEQIEHPTDPARSLWEMKDGGDWKTYNQEVKAFSSEVDFEDLAASRSGVGALGSGSDYTAFLQRYGVASTDMGYGGGPNDPPYHYHSIYDSFTWQSRYGDPGFVKHTAAAKMLGLMALRLADSLVLPLNVTQYAHDLSGYLAKVEAIAQTNDYKVNFTGLSSAINEVQNATTVLDSVAEQALKKLGELLPHPSPKSDPSPLPPKKMKEIKKVLEQIRTVNGKLAGFESGFLSKQGIKDREWYKHKGTAPGKWLGYGATTFPGLTEAMTIDHDVKAAQEEADELEVMMLEIAKHLKI